MYLQLKNIVLFGEICMNNCYCYTLYCIRCHFKKLICKLWYVLRKENVKTNNITAAYSKKTMTFKLY